MRRAYRHQPPRRFPRYRRLEKKMRAWSGQKAENSSRRPCKSSLLPAWQAAERLHPCFEALFQRLRAVQKAVKSEREFLRAGFRTDCIANSNFFERIEKMVRDSIAIAALAIRQYSPL